MRHAYSVSALQCGRQHVHACARDVSSLSPCVCPSPRATAQLGPGSYKGKMYSAFMPPGMNHKWANNESPNCFAC